MQADKVLGVPSVMAAVRRGSAAGLLLSTASLASGRLVTSTASIPAKR